MYAILSPMKSKRKPKVASIVEAATQAKPRRSIPIAEVEEMLNRQADKLTRPPTPYDERLRLIREIESTENERNYHDQQARGLALNVVRLQQELKSINQSIADELDFDSVR